MDLSSRYFIPDEDRGAILSADRRHRYLLWRIWDPPPLTDDQEIRTHITNMCCFVGLNPSTADEREDDPTIRRCVAFAKKWGYDGLWMLNLWAYRATSPKDLKGAGIGDCELEGGERHLHIAQVLIRNADRIVLAWGAHGAWHDAGVGWWEMLLPVRAHWNNLEEFQCLGCCKNGEPRHPLYLAKDTEPHHFWGYPEERVQKPFQISNTL